MNKYRIIFLAMTLTATFFFNEISAQDITNTTAAGASFFVKDAVNTFMTVKPSTGHTGIGLNVTNPRASLEIGGVDGLLVVGSPNSGALAQFGAGSRLHWYPRKGAFRVGMAETSYWDDNGSATPNLALYSIGMGYQPRATGVASTAIGAYNKATADYSLSLGSYNTASGSHSIAIGTQVIASGIYSIALGSGANTNGKDGSVVIGDDSYFQTAYASADNQLTMRFSGGVRIWTSYPDSTAGVYMRHGQSGWSNYCDRNKKENFTQVDGEWLLGKIRNIPITKWNYKKTDFNNKYIGPMAQDFYSAFQLGGTDSLGINTISIDGVNMAGVQALEKRTSEMKKEIERLTAENKKLSNEIAEIIKYKDEIALVRQLKSELEEQIKNSKKTNSENKTEIVHNSINN